MKASVGIENKEAKEEKKESWDFVRPGHL